MNYQKQYLKYKGKYLKSKRQIIMIGGENRWEFVETLPTPNSEYQQDPNYTYIVLYNNSVWDVYKKPDNHERFDNHELSKVIEENKYKWEFVKTLEDRELPRSFANTIPLIVYNKNGTRDFYKRPCCFEIDSSIPITLDEKDIKWKYVETIPTINSFYQQDPTYTYIVLYNDNVWNVYRKPYNASTLYDIEDSNYNWNFIRNIPIGDTKLIRSLGNQSYLFVYNKDGSRGYYRRLI